MCELRRSAVIHLPHQECAREITNMSSAEMRWNACHRIQLLTYPGLRYADVTIPGRCLFAIVIPNRRAATAGTKLAFLPGRTQPVRARSLNFTLPSLLIAFITIWKEYVFYLCLYLSLYNIKGPTLACHSFNSFLSLDLCEYLTFKWETYQTAKHHRDMNPKTPDPVSLALLFRLLVYFGECLSLFLILPFQRFYHSLCVK